MTKTNMATLVALAVLIPLTIKCATWGEAALAAKAEQSADAATLPTPSDEPDWIASAPGRVEPKSGEIKIGAGMNGKIGAVLVEEGQKVSHGDILIQLDDEGTSARFEAAKIEAARSKKDRDDAGGGDSDYRTAEDDVANAELAFWNARDVLDRVGSKRRAGEGTQADWDEARKTFGTTQDLLTAKRNALVDLQARKKRPVPNRQESALAAARSEQSIAAALVEKTHIRAPIDGMVLKLDAKVGQIVAPSPELQLAIVGDTAALRVKAEVDERDVGKVKVGQDAIVRADAFQGQDFTCKVASVSPALSAPELGARGAQRRTDIDVQEIFVQLDPNSPLVPGLRVDVFFKASPATPAATMTPASGAAAPQKPKTP